MTNKNRTMFLIIKSALLLKMFIKRKTLSNIIHTTFFFVSLSALHDIFSNNNLLIILKIELKNQIIIEGLVLTGVYKLFYIKIMLHLSTLNCDNLKNYHD